MFIDFILNWHFTYVINKLQQNKTSPPDIFLEFKINSQTLVNISISSYSKNEEIITIHFSIYPFVRQPNHYLNTSQRNLIVKRLILGTKFNKKSKQEISFFS
ncbi:hypothetical protein [Arsenophonus apicola]|uniref:Uncharacterized protein n=1 Tax=Arsenophonus apicola TaxID=2879119 RepID=A0ABY8P398_9GAMM|nr:hypothetical protein [Arsenophonus apicola]WGO83454.1 hypothetical protein QG404_14215 [Arsenophonus apicola]